MLCAWHHTPHSSHATSQLVVGGEPVLVLELERLFRQRYFGQTTVFNPGSSLVADARRAWARSLEELAVAARTAVDEHRRSAGAHGVGSVGASGVGASGAEALDHLSGLFDGEGELAIDAVVYNTVRSHSLSSLSAPGRLFPRVANRVAAVQVHNDMIVNHLSVSVMSEGFAASGLCRESSSSSSSSSSSKTQRACRVVATDHHRSHATLGLWDAHRELGVLKPLVLSYDGGGNDGYTVLFRGDIPAARKARDAAVGSTASAAGSAASAAAASAAALVRLTPFTTYAGLSWGAHAYRSQSAEDDDVPDGARAPSGSGAGGVDGVSGEGVSFLGEGQADEVVWGNSYAGVGASLPEVLRAHAFHLDPWDGAMGYGDGGAGGAGDAGADVAGEYAGAGYGGRAGGGSGEDGFGPGPLTVGGLRAVAAGSVAAGSATGVAAGSAVGSSKEGATVPARRCMEELNGNGWMALAGKLMG